MFKVNSQSFLCAGHTYLKMISRAGQAYYVTSIFCIHLFISNLTVSHSSLEAIILRKNERQIINHCKNWQFQCKNEQCIAKPFVCDGIKNCEDGSDEDQCWNETSTDESPDTCNKHREQLKKKRARRNADKSCPIPLSSPEKTINYYHCFQNSSNGTCEPTDGYVPEGTIAKVACATGYYQDRAGSPVNTCFEAQWVNEMINCVKKCDKLNPINVFLECSRNGYIIRNCDGNSELLAGTIVQPTCKSRYKYESPPSYLKITCNNDGKWDNKLLPCVPECGKPFTQAQPVIAEGVPEQIGGSPWHVAIFNADKLLICGGTIISATLVLSAAHCFSNGTSTCEENSCAKDYKVVIGKYTRNYDNTDNSYQKIMEIKEIRFSDKGYNHHMTHYANDLAVLILKENIPISSAILPACLNWADLKSKNHPREGELGKVVGWGQTELNILSDVLMNITIPFIGYKRCLNLVHADFKSFITTDKFCAGPKNQTGTLMVGDSGGGILFEENGLYYLRGIASIKEKTSSFITAFTDLSEHITLISLALDEEKRAQMPECYPTYPGVIVDHCEEIVRCILLGDFHLAAEKLQIGRDGDYIYTVKNVYHQPGNTFRSLICFAKSVHQPEVKYKFYKTLYHELSLSDRNDTQKMLELMQRIKMETLHQDKIRFNELYKEIIDKEFVARMSPDFVIMTDQSESQNLSSKVINFDVHSSYSGSVNEKKWDKPIDNFDILFDVYEAVIEKNWDKQTDYTHQKEFSWANDVFNQLLEHMALHEVLTNKLQRTGELETNENAILLARHIKEIQDNSTYKRDIPQQLQSRYEELKKKLPLSPRNIVFSSKVCVKNTAYNEYLYASERALHSRRYQDVYDIYTVPIGEANKTSEYKWTVNHHLDTEFLISVFVNDKFKMSLCHFNGSQHEDGINVPFIGKCDSMDGNWWYVKSVGHQVYIKNYIGERYLFPSDVRKSDDGKRMLVLSDYDAAATSQFRWEIIDCS